MRAGSFGSEAEVWQLTDTGLVVEDEGMLSFALPVFEQHFGAQALTGGIVRFEAVASPECSRAGVMRSPSPSRLVSLAKPTSTCCA